MRCFFIYHNGKTLGKFKELLHYTLYHTSYRNCAGTFKSVNFDTSIYITKFQLDAIL